MIAMLCGNTGVNRKSMQDSQDNALADGRPCLQDVEDITCSISALLSHSFRATRFRPQEHLGTGLGPSSSERNKSYHNLRTPRHECRTNQTIKALSKFANSSPSSIWLYCSSNAPAHVREKLSSAASSLRVEDKLRQIAATLC